MDTFWRIEKRWYAHAAPAAQRRARAVYEKLFRIGLRITGRRFDEYVRDYRGNRGMEFWHDVHDWMGGWPYESISPSEVERMMRTLGFAPVRVFAPRGRIFARYSGVFGSGCDEFVYQRVAKSGT
jgi:2-polyprenyl-6-hydroxyphenyl methylase/3-demethylubiquinone-9 3-methyltransferase